MSNKKHILIVEDEELVSDVIVSRLKSGGYDTTRAFTGLEALEKLQKIKPDLIILDLNLPEMGGIRFYEHICDIQSKPKYPVLILTARADMRNLFKDFQVNGFMVKPFDGKKLLKEVHAILRDEQIKKIFRHPREILIVEDNITDLKKIEKSFSSSRQYKVSSAQDGVEGIEAAVLEVPDIVLIQLGMENIPGDLVILRLQQIERTRHIPCLLYAKRNYEHHAEVMGRLGKKSGVYVMTEYARPQELLDEVNRVFNKIEDEELKKTGFL